MNWLEKHSGSINRKMSTKRSVAIKKPLQEKEYFNFMMLKIILFR